jgi:hypothetical protein
VIKKDVIVLLDELVITVDYWNVTSWNHSSGHVLRITAERFTGELLCNTHSQFQSLGLLHSHGQFSLGVAHAVSVWWQLGPGPPKGLHSHDLPGQQVRHLCSRGLLIQLACMSDLFIAWCWLLPQMPGWVVAKRILKSCLIDPRMFLLPYWSRVSLRPVQKQREVN